jgi:uncharacterized protein
MKHLKFLIMGMLFGFILIKAEVVSWFRIQEMFRFQSFHMYGVICSAIVVGLISLLIIKKLNIKSLDGKEIKPEDKVFNKGHIIGGFIFGLGWAMTGACPGPLYALIGGGFSIIIVALLSAVLGTYVYGVMRERLPH